MRGSSFLGAYDRIREEYLAHSKAFSLHDSKIEVLQCTEICSLSGAAVWTHNHLAQW